MQGRHDVFSHELPMPKLPESAAQYAPPPPPAYSPAGVPAPDMAALNAVERSRLAAEQAKATELDRRLHEVGCAQQSVNASSSSLHPVWHGCLGNSAFHGVMQDGLPLGVARRARSRVPSNGFYSCSCCCQADRV